MRKKIWFLKIGIFNKEKILVGIYRKSAIFKPKYVFTYNSINLEKIEEKIMISSNINFNEYLKQRNCNKQTEYQMLKNEKEEEIGSLIILSQSASPQKTIKRVSSSINNINHEKLKSQKTDNNNKLNIIEYQQKQKEKELINNNNNLNIQIKQLKQELKKKEQQILNNNIEFEKLKKEYDFILQSQSDKNNEINNLKSEISHLKNNEKNLLSISSKEKEIEKVIKDFSKSDNKFPNLNQNHEQ